MMVPDFSIYNRKRWQTKKGTDNGRTDTGPQLVLQAPRLGTPLGGEFICLEIFCIAIFLIEILFFGHHFT